MHGDDDQIVPYADSGPLYAALVQNRLATRSLTPVQAGVMAASASAPPCCPRQEAVQARLGLPLRPEAGMMAARASLPDPVGISPRYARRNAHWSDAVLDRVRVACF
jgi:hypothetical protein